MPKTIIAEGKTTTEAIANGLKMLNASKEMVNIKVLEEHEKRSFFSILAPRVVKVELTLKEENESEKNKKEPVKKQEEKHIKKEKVPVSAENIEKAQKDTKEFLDSFLKQIGENITYVINKPGIIKICCGVFWISY